MNYSDGWYVIKDRHGDKSLRYFKGNVSYVCNPDEVVAGDQVEVINRGPTWQYGPTSASFPFDPVPLFVNNTHLV